MIVLDTNVISEMMRSQPAEAVIHWFGAHTSGALFTTSLNYAEILAGIEMMPDGRRRNRLADTAREMFAADFYGRVLIFDQAAAEHYADIVASRKRMGKPIEPIDAQIAAVARSHEMELATRNVSDFEHCGIAIINPWSD